MEGNQPTHSEEIDLFYLFRPVGGLLRKTGSLISYYFLTLRANLLLFFAIVFVLSALGFSLRYFVPSFYVTQGTFASRLLPPDYCAILTESLDKQLGEPSLAATLHLSDGAADNIQSISLTPMNELLEMKDSNLRSFRIRMRLNNMETLDTIQKALIGYFENNEYVAKRKEELRRNLMALRLDIISKIASLDSVARIVNSSIMPRSSGQGIILGQPIDPVNVYKAQVNYYQQKLEIDRDLANLDNIEVIQSFYKLARPNFPKFNLVFLWAFVVSVGIALFLTPVWGKKPRVQA
jgi:hypothetical protein